MVVKMETAFARVSLDDVARRSAKNIDHKVTFAELDKTPFLAEVDRQLAKMPLGNRKIDLKWHLLASAAPGGQAPRSGRPMSSSAAFQEAFQCKDGSAMVPPAAKRCEVW